MGLLLLLLAASAPPPAGARVQAIATARIVEGTRIQLDSSKNVPEAQRRVVVRRESATPQSTELRLVEFQ
jgi:hypothetical protein